MTLRHLRIFREVCEQKSVTKAAKKLFISQPSVSVVIADMEKKYNVKLFMRIHNRLVITEEGQELYTRACNVLNNFDDFETLAFENSNSNCVKIGTSLTIGTFLLPSLLKRIQTLFPQAQLKVKIFPKDKIESLLLQGELDFGLIENSVKYPELTAIQFYEDKLVAVCSPQFAVGDTLNVQELEKYPLLLREKAALRAISLTATCTPAESRCFRSSKLPTRRPPSAAQKKDWASPSCHTAWFTTPCKTILCARSPYRTLR